jgi:hypothetical protein
MMKFRASAAHETAQPQDQEVSRGWINLQVLAGMGLHPLKLVIITDFHQRNGGCFVGWFTGKLNNA